MLKAIRAFLSHSSTDKGLVNKVASLLGRAAVVYDVFEFTAGNDLQSSILKGISRSQLFVLFASAASLKSDWVKFEIAEAEKAVATQTLSQAIIGLTNP